MENWWENHRIRDKMAEAMGERHMSVFENSFPPSASPTLRYICTKFGQRSPLRLPYLAQISHKVRNTSGEK